MCRHLVTLQGIDLWVCAVEEGVAPVAEVLVVVVATMVEGMDIQGGDVVTLTQTISLDTTKGGFAFGTCIQVMMGEAVSIL